ncbi:MAG: phytanoyl-CoA dioxygenase family protein [Vicinamibacteria bacterium]
MVRDLADIQHPIAPHERSPRGALEQYRLADTQVRLFQENGYLSGIRILDEGQVDGLRAELEKFLSDGLPASDLLYELNVNESLDPSKRLLHCLGHWRILPAFHDLLWNPALTVPASQLLGGAVRFWHDQLFYKPPANGGVVAWHQDYSYWTRTKPMSHLTCWIALDDSTLENGCVHYVPGSHRWPLLPRPALSGNMDAIQSVLSGEQREAFRPAPSEVRAGFASFHHPLTLHGSYENRSAVPRRGAVVNVVRDGVVSDSDEPLLAGVPVVPRGRPLAGRFFPLLFDPAVPFSGAGSRA